MEEGLVHFSPISPENFTKAVENSCLHQAMLEAVETPLLDRDAVLAYLEYFDENLASP